MGRLVMYTWLITLQYTLSIQYTKQKHDAISAMEAHSQVKYTSDYGTRLLSHYITPMPIDTMAKILKESWYIHMISMQAIETQQLWIYLTRESL